MFEIKVGIEEVVGASERLKKVGFALSGPTALKSVNKVADRTFELSRKKMLSGINLTDADFNEGMEQVPATDPVAPVAKIVAARDRERPMTLRRFVVDQVVETNTWSNSFVASQIAKNRFNANKRSKGKGFPWKLRTGDKMRGISAGNKAHGLAVQIKRGSRKYGERWFWIRGKNGYLLPATVRKNAAHSWKRSQKDKNIHVLFGPSIWQLFKAQIPGMKDQVRADLAKTLSSDVRGLFLEVLK